MSLASSSARSAQINRRRYFPPSEKDFLEGFYVRRREVQAREREYWSGADKYFKESEVKARKWDQLTSSGASSASEQSHLYIMKRREARKANLLVRRERLKRLMAHEASAYEAELRSLPSSGSITGLRDEREIMKARKEKEAREEAHRKMEQHWKLNNPEFRELMMKKHRDIVVEAWKTQSDERNRKEEEERKKEELRSRLEEERRCKENEELAAKEKEKEERISEWKEIIRQQIKDLKDKEKEEEWINIQIANELVKKDEIECLKEEFTKTENTRRKKELGNYLQRQSRLKLRIRAKQVQEELEEDRMFLERLKFIEESEKSAMNSVRLQRIKDIEWMRKVLKDQKVEEEKRKKEMELLFTEEARTMWKKQEQIWEKEKAARESLMRDVLNGIETQIQRKIEDKQYLKKRLESEKQALDEEIQSMNRNIEEERYRKRAKAVQLAESLSHQISQKVKEPVEEDIEGECTLNQLSHRIGKWNI